MANCWAGHDTSELPTLIRSRDIGFVADRLLGSFSRDLSLDL